MISIEFLKEDPDRLFTEKEIAESGLRSVSCLQRDRWAGEGLPYVKIGRSVYYRAADVLEYIEHSRVNTAA